MNYYKPNFTEKYKARLDIWNSKDQSSHGGINESDFLHKMPTLKWCETFFKKSMSKELKENEYWNIDVQIYEWENTSNECGELKDVKQLKEYK